MQAALERMAGDKGELQEAMRCLEQEAAESRYAPPLGHREAPHWQPRLWQGSHACPRRACRARSRLPLAGS
jgi:hypothetical protein